MNANEINYSSQSKQELNHSDCTTGDSVQVNKRMVQLNGRTDRCFSALCRTRICLSSFSRLRDSSISISECRR